MVMKIKKLRNRYKECKAQKEANLELYKYYKELSDIGIGELKFERMNVEHLVSVLEEIKTFTKDELVKAVIEKELNRYNLDKIIHAKTLFNK